MVGHCFRDFVRCGGCSSDLFAVCPRSVVPVRAVVVMWSFAENELFVEHVVDFGQVRSIYK